MKKAIIHGCYNTTNFGDLLLLELLAKHISTKGNIICYTYKIPKGIELEYCHVINSKLDWFTTDLAIFGGGGYLHDENGDPVVTQRLLRYTIPARIWKLLGINYCIIGPGGGPDATGKGLGRIKWLCNNAQYISIRDAVTVDFLRKIGVKRQDIETTADLALLLTKDDIPAKAKFDMENFVGVNSKNKKIIVLHLEKIYENKESFLHFLSLSFFYDKVILEHFHFIFMYDYETVNLEWIRNELTQIQNLSFSILERTNHWVTVDFLRQCDAVFTTKLHVSIVSVAFNIPVFGVSFHEKTQRFFKEINRGKYQQMLSDDLSCIDLWMRDLKEGLDEAWNLDSDAVGEIKSKAAVNIKVVDSYLRDNIR